MGQVLPKCSTSWGYGTFHQNNPIYINLVNTPQASGNNQAMPGSQIAPGAQNMNLKTRPQSAGNPNKIVTNEYLRVINDQKRATEIGKKSVGGKTTKSPTQMIARCRFDLLEPPSPEKAERAKVVERVGHTNPNTIMFVDKNKDREEQLNEIVLPANSLYLIDKVVRQKASSGPIGVDNSEVINIELERELKRRNRALYGEADEEGVDDPKLTEQEREDRINHKLLQRLLNAANIEENKRSAQKQRQGDDDDEHEGAENEGHIDNQAAHMIDQAKHEIKKQIAYEEWYRAKEHQTSLRKALIREAKEDLLEKMLEKQEQKDQENEQRYQEMFAWGERKLIEEARERESKLKKEEQQRLAKHIQKEKSYQVFKEWLKSSLIKLRQEVIQKKIQTHEQRMQNENERKKKENNRVMAKIRYNEWNEKKAQEARHRKALEKMHRRQIKIQEEEKRRARLDKINEMKSHSGNSGQILLAYGLNKNLKKLKMDVPSSGGGRQQRASSAKGNRASLRQL